MVQKLCGTRGATSKSRLVLLELRSIIPLDAFQLFLVECVEADRTSGPFEFVRHAQVM